MSISNKITLPFSAKKRCLIKMGPKQTTVGSVALCPYSTTIRVLSIKDIRLCLGVGAKVVELRNDDIQTVLTIENFSEIFDEKHFEFIKKFNADIKTPVEKRESYLIDIPKEPIPPKKEEKDEDKKEEVETIIEEVKNDEEVTVTSENQVSETIIEETPETVEEDENNNIEETVEEQPVVNKYNNYNKKRNRH